MNPTIKIPAGWRRLRKGEMCTEGTHWIEYTGDDPTPAGCAIGAKRRINKNGTIASYNGEIPIAFIRRITPAKKRGKKGRGK